jgi:hypothetical protein
MAKSISIPKTPRSAYDPKRKVSSLLKAHIANLEAVTTRTPGARRLKPRTEAQASAYIAEMTQQLHPEIQRAGPPAPAAALPQPAAPPFNAAPARARTARRSKAKPAPRGRARKTAKRTLGAKK